MNEAKGKRVAVLVEKFYEDLELWYPVLRLREAGAEVRIVGPKAGESYESKHGYPAKADVSAAEVSADDFDAIIIPGGYSPDHMRRCPPMVDLVTEAAQRGKVLAAICHGPWMLCSTKAIKGRRLTGYKSIRDDVENAGRRLGRRPLRRRRQPRHQPDPRRPPGFHGGRLQRLGRPRPRVEPDVCPFHAPRNRPAKAKSDASSPRRPTIREIAKRCVFAGSTRPTD